MDMDMDRDDSGDQPGSPQSLSQPFEKRKREDGDTCAHSESELWPRLDNTWDPTSERGKKMARKEEENVEIGNEDSVCSCGRHLPKEDRISSLPDDALLLILSLLPLKEMVKTSILSSRWLNLWVHTPVLDIHVPIPYADPIHVNDEERLFSAQWVSHVLKQYKGCTLKELKIVCRLDGRMKEHIDNWLVIALSKNVQHLELTLSRYRVVPGKFIFNDYVLPDQFTKSVLKCLKSVCLKNVAVTNEAFNCLLLNCLLLERLEVDSSAKLAILEISGRNLVLKYLKIKCGRLKVLRISNFNLVSLDIPSVGEVTLKALPMLVGLSLSRPPSPKNNSFSEAAQLEALTMGPLLWEDVRELSNLDQLTKLRRLVLKFVASGDENLTILIPIINLCPRLEEFVLRFIWYHSERTTTIEAERNNTSSRHKSLKVFEFMGFDSQDCDFALVLHMVQNAINLQKIIIDPRNAIIMESGDLVFDDEEDEHDARSLAKKKLKALQESETIPSNVEVIIR